MHRFKFLEERFPELSDYGRKAEESFEADKNICLLNLGRIAEHITAILCEQNHIPDNNADELLKLGIIDENVHRKIETLIEIKDEAVNDEYGSEMSCERLLAVSEELCRWFMSERGESRFSFLADLFPESNPVPPLADLALYGREAEENLFPNTRYSLICLGDIEESIVERILRIEDIDANVHDNDQSDRINLLYNKGIITKDDKERLDDLRRARNKAVHCRYNSREECMKLIEEALSICEWTFRFVMSKGNFIRGTIKKVNENSIEVGVGRIECVVEGDEIPESNEPLNERYKEGEKRIFKVTDSEGEIIKLSIKDVYTDPWINTARRYEKYEIGQVLNVKVMSFTDYMGAIAEIVGPLEITEAMIPETEYGRDKPRIGQEVKARVKWFNPKTYPYMILSVKDVPDEKKNFVAMCADSSADEIRERLSDVSEEIDVNEKNHNGMTALMNAAMHNTDPEVIRVLIDAGAKVNAVNMNSSGNTALMFAAMYNSPEVVKALIEGGANVNARNKFGDTALSSASVENNAKAVNAILEAGADINSQNANGTTALMSALYNSADVENIIKALLAHKPDLALRNKKGNTAVDIARTKPELSGSKTLMVLLGKEFLRLCRSGSEEEIEQAVIAGVNIHTRNKSQATGLMFAAQHNTAKAVEVLIDSGSDIDAQDIHGNTALIYAASYNSDDVVDVLIGKGADVNIMNHSGHKALKFAKMNYRLYDTVAINVLEELTRD